MTYEELKQLAPGTLVRVKGGVYDYMFIQDVSPFDHMIRVEMNGVNQNVDTSQVSSLTEYDTAMIKRMYEAVFPVKETDSRFEEVVNFIEKLK